MGRPRLPLKLKSTKLRYEYIETLSDVLTGCQRIAEASSIPGLALFIAIAKGIVDTAKYARSNVESASRLAERVCKLLQAISEQLQGRCLREGTDAPLMDDIDEAFTKTLEEIEITKITDRAWYMIVFCVLRDKRTIEDNNKKLDDALVLFQVHGIKPLRDEASGIMHKLDQMFGVKLDQMVGIINQTFQLVKALALPKESESHPASKSSLSRQPQARERRPYFFSWFRPNGVVERERRPYRKVFRPRMGYERGDILDDVRTRSGGTVLEPWQATGGRSPGEGMSQEEEEEESQEEEEEESQEEEEELSQEEEEELSQGGDGGPHSSY